MKEASHPDILSTVQCAKQLGISPQSLTAWARKGKIPYWRPGNVYLFHWPTVLSHMVSQMKTAVGSQQEGLDGREETSRISDQDQGNLALPVLRTEIGRPDGDQAPTQYEAVGLQLGTPGSHKNLRGDRAAERVAERLAALRRRGGQGS